MSEQTDAVVACAACGTIHPGASSLLDTVARQERKISYLEGELTKKRKELEKTSPSAQVKELGDFYRSELAVNGNWVFDSSRQKLAGERLSEVPIERLKLAILGLKARPYVGTGDTIGRFAEKRPGTKRDVRFELVMRDAQKVDQFAAYAEEEQELSEEARVLLDLGRFCIAHAEGDPDQLRSFALWAFGEILHGRFQSPSLAMTFPIERELRLVA